MERVFLYCCLFLWSFVFCWFVYLHLSLRNHMRAPICLLQKTGANKSEKCNLNLTFSFNLRVKTKEIGPFLAYFVIPKGGKGLYLQTHVELIKEVILLNYL